MIIVELHNKHTTQLGDCKTWRIDGNGTLNLLNEHGRTIRTFAAGMWRDVWHAEPEDIRPVDNTGTVSRTYEEGRVRIVYEPPDTREADQ